jgi:murein DD-endopeptidase MepM/ murein hydrolase activator NlpD
MKKILKIFRPTRNFFIFMTIPIIGICLFFGFRKTIAEASSNAKIEVLLVENQDLKKENSEWQKLYYNMYKVQQDYRDTVKQIADLMLYTKMGAGGSDEIVIKASDEMTIKYAQQAYTTSKEFLDNVYGLKNWAEIFNRYFKESPFIYPVKSDGTVKLSSGYGFRDGLFKSDKDKLKFHPGVDLAGKIGDPIQATANGKVKWVETNNSIYGKLVIVQHDLGFETWYAHLSKINVKIGQSVKQGTIIGLMGESGESTGPHLHYEIHFGEKTVDPMWFLSL